MRRAYAMLCLLLVACDPTAGLSDSADAALPKLKRYFDGRGTQVAEGPWNRVVVDLDAETLYHVGGRRLDDDEPTFHLFGQDVRDGCKVAPNAGTYLVGKAPAAPFRLLPFLESIDERGRGRLRFTGLDCVVQDLVLEDAGRPYPRLYDHGFLVPTQRGYTFADPWEGTTQVIAQELDRVLVWSDSSLLWADGALNSFTAQLEPGASWGNAVSNALALREDFLVEDADGLHRVKFSPPGLEIDTEKVLDGACHVQLSNSVDGDAETLWLAAELPCGNPKPSLLQLDAKSWEVLDRIELPFEADARHMRALLLPATSDDEAEAPTLGAAYLTDVNESGFGDVWLWREGQEAPVAVGTQGEVDTLLLTLVRAEWDGLVQVSYRELGGVQAYDWLQFRWDGSTAPFAEGVVRNSATGETLVNFDGVAADLPRFRNDGYDVLLESVPPTASQVTSYVGERHYARVDSFDGESGRLRLGTTVSTPATWSAIGSAVFADSVRFPWFMPAIVFLEEWNAEAQTGKLVAYNYELDARTTIADGVSSFDLTSYPWDGVVYSVPRGKQRGIWFSKAK